MDTEMNFLRVSLYLFQYINQLVQKWMESWALSNEINI